MNNECYNTVPYENSYDSQGNLIKQVRNESNGTYTFEYEYNDAGMLVYYTQYKNDGLMLEEEWLYYG